MSETLRIEKPVYGGCGLSPLADCSAIFVPFALPGETVEAEIVAGKQEAELLRVLDASPARTEPGCPHFGACGGCHLQMATYDEQLRLKSEVLQETLQRAGVTDTSAITVNASPSPWGYRNRIRLHVVEVEGVLQLGYRRRSSQEILPIRTCPIATPLLWHGAEALLHIAAQNLQARALLRSVHEVELFCDADEHRLQMTLLGTSATQHPRFAALAQNLNAILPQLASLDLVRVDKRSGLIREALQSWGTKGIPYKVPSPWGLQDQTFWIAPGSFFQVNRFLIELLVDLVCSVPRRYRRGARTSIQPVWDLYAGVGLFSRFLYYEDLKAVEVNPVAVAELRSAFKKSPGSREAVESPTLDFLRGAVVQRERPSLIILDPPRAGAGVEACEILTRLAPREIAYVSCDPTTLARDLQVLQPFYKIVELHLVDLFPQTFHIETIAFLVRK